MLILTLRIWVRTGKPRRTGCEARPKSVQHRQDGQKLMKIHYLPYFEVKISQGTPNLLNLHAT